jgi:hypothetical protein
MVDISEVQRYNVAGFSFSWSGFVSALYYVEFAKQQMLQDVSVVPPRPPSSPFPGVPVFSGPRSRGLSAPSVSDRGILKITTSSVLCNLNTVSPFASPHEVLFVPSNSKHYVVTSAMRADPSHPGVMFIDVEERDGPCTRGEPPPPSPDKDIFMLLGRPDVHDAFSGTANAEVEFVDVPTLFPFYRFVFDHIRQPPSRFKDSRISIVRTRREVAFCSDIIRESQRITNAPAHLKPHVPDPLRNAVFIVALHISTAFANKRKLVFAIMQR